MADKTVAFNILARDQASKTFQNVGDAAEKSHSKVKAFGLALSGGLAAGFAAVGAVAKTGYGELRDYQAGLAQAQAVVKSTGGAAGVTASHVEDLASKIQNYSGQTDDSIVAGENLLLTFTNIRNEAGKGNDVFDQSTKILADMSQALGQDTKTSAIQLGKALNDPIRGVTALQKVGVSFSEAQKTTIKRLEETGHTAEAQKVILKELGREFGGSAKAFGDSGPGQIAKAKRAFEDLSQNLVTALLPTLTGVASFVTGQVLPAMSKLGDFLGRTLGPVVSAVTGAVQVFFQFLKGDDDGVDGPFRKAAVAGQYLHDKIREMQPTIHKLVDIFRNQVLPALQNFGEFVMSRVVPILERVFQVIATRVVPVFIQMATFIVQRVIPAVLNIYQHVAQKLKPAFEALAQFVMTRVIPAVQGLWARFQQVLPTLEKVGLVVLKVAGFFLGFVASVVGKVFPIVLKLAGPIFTLLFAAIGKVIGIVSSLANIFISTFKFIIDGAASAFGWVPGIGPKLKSAAKQFDAFARSVQASLTSIKPPPIVLNVRLGGAAGAAAATAIANKQNRLDGRASGGPVTANTAYLVGEQGPEIVVPSTSGTVMNATKTAGLLGGSINITVNAPGHGNPQEIARQTVNALRRYKKELGGGELGIA
ncbi:MAG: phage tail length tape measure family protein [Blastococcus sp.]